MIRFFERIKERQQKRGYDFARRLIDECGTSGVWYIDMRMREAKARQADTWFDQGMRTAFNGYVKVVYTGSHSGDDDAD